MRTPALALALVLVACGRSDRAGHRAAAGASPPAVAASTTSGPDQLALRFPRGGGIVRAFAYPRLDSVVWSSSDKAPPIERLLGFDDEAGQVAAVDTKGGAVRIDLHLGTVSVDAKPVLSHLTSVNGSAIYGLTSDGSVMRLTPSASWTFKPPTPASDVIPEPDGALLILADRGSRTALWQMYPPDRSITDTAILPSLTRAMPTPVGDRVYFVVDSGLIGIRSRGLVRLPSIRFDHHVRTLTTTPSGDRIYIAVDSTPRITVIDRYTHKVETRIETPGQVAGLRMDPLGRYVLARPTRGDSCWVVAVGTDRLIGTVKTAWRSDLPIVAPNGWLAMLRGRDVVFVDGHTLQEQRTVAGGGADTWLFIAWNGFRPRPKGLDEPVTFNYDTARTDTSDTANAFAGGTPPGDTAAIRARAESTHAGAAPRDTASHAASAGFTVQFGALRSEDLATSLAHHITVQGAQPRVVAVQHDGITIYRVVIGPFATRAEAERVAKTSGTAYWIYEGAP